MNRLTNWWKTEKPPHIREYKKGNIIGALKYLLLNLIIGFLLLFLYDIIEYQYSEAVESPYLEEALKGNAVYFFTRFFMWTIPVIIAGVINTKTLTPLYGFASLGGYLLASLSFYYFNPVISIYSGICALMLILANLPSHKEYILKSWHLIYYLLLGIAVSAFNIEIMVASDVIWVYIQFVYLNLFMAILIAVKIRPWGYVYLIGWFLYALITMLAFPSEKYYLIGLYNVLAPSILAWGVFTYFYKIYLPMADRFRTK